MHLCLGSPGSMEVRFKAGSVSGSGERGGACSVGSVRAGVSCHDGRRMLCEPGGCFRPRSRYQALVRVLMWPQQLTIEGLLTRSQALTWAALLSLYLSLRGLQVRLPGWGAQVHSNPGCRQCEDIGSESKV